MLAPMDQYSKDQSPAPKSNDTDTVASESSQDMVSPAVGEPKAKKLLNPYAKKWDPITDRAPDEDRCLFLTFSNGHALTRRQIIDFFHREYGADLEYLYMHRKSLRYKTPLFAKAVFRRSEIPAVVLAGQTEVKFIVEKKPLWCKRFYSKNSIDGVDEPIV